MATANQYQGRVEAIGVGLESTPGTAVAPAAFMRWTDQDFHPVVDVAEDDSALGVVDGISGSEVVGARVEATIGGHVSDAFIGYLLAGFYGSPSTGAAVSGIYPHTFTMGQSAIPKTLTFAHYTPLVSKRYNYGVVDAINLTAESGGFVDVSCPVKARVGSSNTVTPSLTAETLFTSKHITVKTASSVAGLSGATALKVSRVELNQERPSEAWNPLGTHDVPEFDRGTFKVTGSMTLRYTDTAYEENMLANTAVAMEVAMTNGTKSLKFTMGQVRTRELERSVDKDGIVTLTISFAAEYSLSDAKSVTAVLNNAVSSLA